MESYLILSVCILALAGFGLLTFLVLKIIAKIKRIAREKDSLKDCELFDAYQKAMFMQMAKFEGGED